MEKFKAKRVKRSCTIQVNGKPSEIFPLLCPVREYEWIDTWHCDLVFTDSGLMENDIVFATDFDDMEKEFWYGIRHEPDKEVQFLRFGTMFVTRLAVLLSDNGDNTTSLNWSSIITSLNEAGNTHIDTLSVENYNNVINMRCKELNSYIENKLNN